jgi:hypothetical protein
MPYRSGSSGVLPSAIRIGTALCVRANARASVTSTSSPSRRRSSMIGPGSATVLAAAISSRPHGAPRLPGGRCAAAHTRNGR